jgi:nucleotide-binding universal stress UspA family protein
MYGQVIVPLDGSTFAARAVTPAMRVAERVGAGVLLVGYTRTEAHRKDLERELLDAVEGLAPMSSVPVDQRTAVIALGGAAAIAADAHASPGSLVCMAVVGRSNTEPPLGSVADSVLRDVDDAVLLIGPEVDVENWTLAGTVEVPVDGSEHAEKIFPFVAQWAAAFGLGIRVVTVEAVETETELDLGASDYLHHVARLLGGEGCVDLALLHGDDPGERIVADVADRTGVIAMTTHGRSGLRSVVAGSTAMHILRRAPLPVLTYRPS